MLEEELIRHAAPTLAGLKAASLFSTPATPEQLRLLGEAIRPLRLLSLRRTDGRALVYVYRPGMLKDALAPASVQRFLYGRGYAPACMEGLLIQLRARCSSQCGIPHEIGVFLGYPLEDVKGFIRHQGRDALLSGCWKVYAHPRRAARLFRRYHACRSLYTALYASGVPLRNLIAGAAQASGPHHPPDWSRSPQ